MLRFHQGQICSKRIKMQKKQREESIMNLDYFYGAEGEQYRFYQIPAILLEHEEYRKISDTAKLLYGILLSRLALSKKNGWIEEDTNRVYILYNRNDIASMMGKGTSTISSAMTQLVDVGLIKKKKQGLGKSDILYVMNFASMQEKESFNDQYPDVDQEETEAYGEDIQSPFFGENREEKPLLKSSEADIQGVRDAYKEIVRKQIDYETLKQTSYYDVAIIDNIVDIMVNIYASKKEYIYISGENIFLNEVINRLKRITFTHIEYIMTCLKENTTQIRKPDSYLLTALYNAPATIDFYYAAKVQHDWHGHKNNTYVDQNDCG